VLSGAAKANDQPGYRFTFTACPAPAGTGLGSFAIALTGPLGFNYQKSGALTLGFIKLHTP
jgi:hypothetical protein